MGARVTMTFAVPGMHCASCGLLIDDAVEELEGVERCESDSRRGRTVMVADPTVATADDVVVAITTAGYRAEASGAEAVEVLAPGLLAEGCAPRASAEPHGNPNVPRETEEVMEYLAYLLGPLGCVLGMVVLMARGMRRPDSGMDPAQPKEVADLRAEVAELRGNPSPAGDA